eukprot:GEMP01056235.1.p1 GENE.GEMP01056235.1~~GEMP01056235.1.p1  ORF type:complete len:306 (+),score=92.02 GEMP01056235.1:227-1144(+)
MVMTLTDEIIKRQDDMTTTALIDFLSDDPQFIQLSDQEQKLIIDRDVLDAEALKAGIILAQEKKVLPIQDPKKYQAVEVQGKTADQVADEIIGYMGDKAHKGCVVCLVGLSGTGKGTTVEKLKQKLPLSSTWSNGNIFRSLTLLAATACEQQNKELCPDVLTAENLATWVDYLSFGKNAGGAWDTTIEGLGIQAQVSEVQNTLLKEPKVASNIPIVAKQTQGEVVKFAADACNKMGAGGAVVLLEGREQTLDFIPADFRFCLTLSDASLLGKRRAAQRVAASALKSIAGTDNVGLLVKQCLQKLL